MFSFTFLVFIIFLLFLIYYISLNHRKDNKKENQDLVGEVCEYDYNNIEGLLNKKSDDEVVKIFINILDSHIQNQQVSEKVLNIICEENFLYRLMRGTILSEIKRFNHIIDSEESSEDIKSETLIKKQKLIALLDELGNVYKKIKLSA